MKTKDIVYIALFCALTAALGLFPQVNVPVINVPVTAQTLGVMIAGGVLGAKRGSLAILLFMVLVVAGLPLLAGGRGGVAVLAGPTVGFFLGFLPGAFVTGFIVERLWRRLSPVWAFVAAAVGGIVVIYPLGIAGLALVAGAPLDKAIVGSAAFIPGDLIKAALAAGVIMAVKRAYPLIEPQRA